MQTQHEMAGIYRFGVVYNPSIHITWAKYKYVSKIRPEVYSTMENEGVRKGGIPSDWYACFHDIRSHFWNSIEVFDGRKWIPLNDVKEN